MRSLYPICRRRWTSWTITFFQPSTAPSTKKQRRGIDKREIEIMQNGRRKLWPFSKKFKEVVQPGMTTAV